MRILKPGASIIRACVRYNRRARRPYLRDLYYRRLIQGPEVYRPRSAWLCWDNDAEHSAFLNRIRNSVSLGGLNRALIDRSYTEFINAQCLTEESSRRLENNDSLVFSGRQLAYACLLSALRLMYPKMPEEWIMQLKDHLMNTYRLANTAALLGLKDLVVYALPGSSELSPSGNALPNNPLSGPPPLTALADCMMALIGTMVEENRMSEALHFIQEFVLASLTDLDSITDVITVDKPLLLLTGFLKSQGRGIPEARLQWQCGMNTLLSCYQVGIYSDRELIGQAPGETVEIAEEEATLQALYNVFEIPREQPIIPESLYSVHALDNGEKNMSVNTLYEMARSTDEYVCAPVSHK